MTSSQSQQPAPVASAIVPRDAPRSSPVRAAVVENRDDGTRLMIFDLRTGEGKPVSPADKNARAPVWSPDGSSLIYRLAGTLMLHRQDVALHESLLEALNTQTNTPYAFSPDGQRIAALLSDAVVVLPVDRLRGSSVRQRVPMPSGCKPFDLLWSSDNATLFTLCYPRPGGKEQLLVNVDIATAHTSLQSVGSVNRLLGWARPPNSILFGRPSGLQGEEAGTQDPNGTFRTLHKGPEDEPESILAFLPAPALLAVALMGEDPGASVHLRLAHLDNQPSHPWLEGHPHLSGLAFSKDGKWALFADRSRFTRDLPGGDIYLVSVGSEDAKLVLKGEPEKVSYTSPVPWP